MAKNSFPMPTAGSGPISKVLGTAVGLGFLVFVVNHPVDAAHLLTSAFAMFKTAVEGIANFLTQFRA